ncbi:epithelial membrane protein 3-like [Littorina saxatilis]|uniref:epithelial membrane protein 3-like n=1 Tax=Littorina saxatilis TaxID=31220 RepID=UPI0038B68D0C
MLMSGHFAASLAMLLIAAILYLVAIGTSSWSTSRQELSLGLWRFCMDIEGDKTWTCLPNNTDFSMAAQAFSMLAVLCYVVSFLMYLAYIVFPSLSKSRPLTMALCLLVFSIVCLQLMAMIVYGVKMEELHSRAESVHFMQHLHALNIAWSFAFAIVSSIIATASGVCTFLELRNVHLDELTGAGTMPRI